MAIIESNNTIAGTYGPYRLAGTPVNGVSGSFLGALKGAKLVDTTTGVQYTNTGSESSPTWTVIGTQS